MNSVKVNGTLTKNWNTEKILSTKKSFEKYAVIILNQPIQIESKLFISLWKNAILKVTVDGGTNHWLTWIKQNDITNIPSLLPNFIIGDLDSISKETLDFFKSYKDAPVIIETPNQNATDFTKTLKEINTYQKKNDIQFDALIVIIEPSGRMDQTLSNINTLFLAPKLIPDVPVFLLASDSLSWLLAPGCHTINIPRELKNDWCGLIPIGGICKNVFTTGLKWNIENKPMEFGHLISTSNTYSGDSVVTVKTSDFILWSMGLEDLNSSHTLNQK